MEGGGKAKNSAANAPNLHSDSAWASPPSAAKGGQLPERLSRLGSKHAEPPLRALSS